MTKTLTISLDASVYDGLHRVVGSDGISTFIETLVRPHVVDLDEAYAAMAQDEERSAEALVWSESHLPHLDGDEAR